MGKLSEIVNGWNHLVFRDEEVEKIAMKRANICGDCDKLSTSLGFYLHCGICKCYIPAKVRSTEARNKCPLKKW